ncbi:MAG: PAS domain S-box protein [Phycisphaerae bacterium]|nr:PAS domain S-box protein [Phycisphaerae bacterium]
MSASVPSTNELAFLDGGGEMGALMRAFDWTQTPLGPPARWPQSLRITTRILLSSRYAMWMGWGPELTFFYNDAYGKMTLGPKHPWALGRSAREVWAEIWHDVGPRAESVVTSGIATWDEGLLLYLERLGYPEETYHTFSYSPVPDDHGGIGGMLCVVTEETERVIGERRLKTLRELAARTLDEARTPEEACRTASTILSGNSRDVPFAALYLLEHGGTRATLAGQSGLGRGPVQCPDAIEIDGATTMWPFRHVIATRQPEIVDLSSRPDAIVSPEWPEPIRRAVVVPMTKSGQGQLSGFLVAGISPRRPFDDAYAGFFDLAARQVATAVANARAYEEERQRAEALAELDRAKTAFFSNISHEFRTPLTLMLSPLQDALNDAYGALPPAATADLAIANRSALRLQKLVNALLDFSRIEAGRMQATYQATELAAMTAELASSFRSAIERSGVRLVVECPPLSEPVYVDHDMWERIVLNLLSNAFKYTLQGEIVVQLRRVKETVELSVRDTGSGIPEYAMPRLFERFFRVEGSAGRTHEGTGIGLAMVSDLVKLHGGTIRAESEVGVGSTFTITIPFGYSHLPKDQVELGRAATPRPVNLHGVVEEATAWLFEDEPAGEASSTEEPANTRQFLGASILLADDNADMRRYIERLLASRGAKVRQVSDGKAALDAAKESLPDLIVTDVMMPHLNGFELLAALRADPATRPIPILMVSARAGEEATVEGLDAGADDYIVKPFTARELVARIESQIKLARLRNESELAVRKSEEQFRAIFEQTTIGVAQIDLTGRFTLVNDRYCEIVGRPREELLTLRVQDITHPVDVAGNVEHFKTCVETGRPFDIEKRYVRPDGSEAWVHKSVSAMRDSSGTIQHMAAAATDITDRKRAEQALRESEARFSNLANTAPAVLWVTDPDGSATFLSRGWHVYTGQSDEESLGFGWLNAVHPDDREESSRIFLTANRKHEAFDLRHRVRRADGEFRWVMDSGRPRFDEDGTFLGFIGAVIDVHERALAENELAHHRDQLELAVRERTAELEATHRQLRLSERMAALGTLSAGLGHDMGNLLVPIRVRLESLAQAELPSALKRDVEAIRTSTEYLRKLSNGLRMLALEPGANGVASDPTELRSWWDEAEPMLRNSLPRGVTLGSRIPSEPCWVQISRAALAQSVFNLVQNAGDAMKARGYGNVTISARSTASRVQVQVTDDGPGMSPDVKARCMEPFFSTKTRGISTGLGLALVYGLVQDAGGSIAIESSPGRGSTFTLSLLPSPGPTTSPRPAKGRSAALSVRDARMRAIMISELRSLGFDVVDEAERPVDAYVADDISTLQGQRPTAIVLLGPPPASNDHNGSIIAIGAKPSPQTIREALRGIRWDRHAEKKVKGDETIE